MSLNMSPIMKELAEESKDLDQGINDRVEELRDYMKHITKYNADQDVVLFEQSLLTFLQYSVACFECIHLVCEELTNIRTYVLKIKLLVDPSPFPDTCRNPKGCSNCLQLIKYLSDLNSLRVSLYNTQLKKTDFLRSMESDVHELFNCILIGFDRVKLMKKIIEESKKDALELLEN